MGYDSVALLEAVARIAREYDILLDNDATIAARTPFGTCSRSSTAAELELSRPGTEADVVSEGRQSL